MKTSSTIPKTQQDIVSPGGCADSSHVQVGDPAGEARRDDHIRNFRKHSPDKSSCAPRTSGNARGTCDIAQTDPGSMSARPAGAVLGYGIIWSSNLSSKNGNGVEQRIRAAG